VLEIFPIEAVEIGEHGRRFFEADAMLLEVLSRLFRVPGEHIYVYTLNREQGQTNISCSFVGVDEGAMRELLQRRIVPQKS